MMLRLLQFLNSIHPLNAEIEQHLIKILRHKQINKNRFWLKEGDICNKIAFIESGLLKIFIQNGEKEACIWFNKEDDIVISVKSFFKRTPSEFSIQAVETTEIYYIEQEELQRLYELSMSFNINGRLLVQEYYTASEDHVLLMHKSAAERYKQLAEKSPWIIQRVSDKELASYLNITPGWLSKIKSENHSNI